MKHTEDSSSNPLPEKLVLKFFDRVWHEPHDLDTIDELMTEDYVITTAGKRVEGRAAFKAWVGKFQQQLLDAKTESVDIFSNAQGDKVVSRWICSGKNNGLFGLEADDRFISFSGMAIWSIRDQRLAECWVERSGYELYQDLVSDSHESDFV
ncbi:MAG: nuclear transport factor 2 family protein [Bacteroidota bacterium]